MIADVPVQDWTVGDVGEWLRAVGLDKYEATFGEHLIDGRALLTISEADLRKPPLELRLLGDIKNIMICIRELQRQNVAAVRQLLGASEPLPAFTDAQTSSARNSMDNESGCSDGPESSPDVSSDSEDDEESDDGHSAGAAASPGPRALDFKPEIRKMGVGVLYFLSVAWSAAMVMAIVRDRETDREAYPPLPDIFPDNAPPISRAFAMCKLVGLLLFVVWVWILACRHRVFLLRRMFALLGAVFVVR